MPDRSPPSHSYEIVQTNRAVGTMDGPTAFGIIRDLTTHPNGTLAVFDGPSCEIVLIEVESLHVVRRIGGCGNGPGELGRSNHSLVLTADSILVLDGQSDVIKVLDYNGREGRVLRVSGLRSLGARPEKFLGVADDTTWVLGLALYWSHGMPPEGAVLHDNLLAHIDARSGTLLTTYHRDEDLSIANRLEALRNVTACMSPGTGGGVAAFSHFTFSAATYERGSTSPRAEFRLSIDWAPPTRREPGWIWAPGFFVAACSEEFAMFSFLSVPGDGQRVERGHLEIRDFEGKILLVSDLSRADSTLFGRVAALGNRIYVSNDFPFGYPVIHEFELRRIAR